MGNAAMDPILKRAIPFLWMPTTPTHISPSPALRKLCETMDENEPTEQVKQEVIQELVETWELGRAVNVNYSQDKAAVAGAAVNEKAVVEYLQARAQALCDMGLLDEQGMHAILQGRLQKRDSAYEDIENAVNAHWPPRRRKIESQEMKPVLNNITKSSMDDITNKMTVTQNCKDRRASIMALGDAFSQAYDNILSQGKHSEQKDTFILEQSNMQATANDDGNGLTTGDSNTNHSDRNNEKIHDNFKQRTSKRHRLKLVEKHNCCVLQ